MKREFRVLLVEDVAPDAELIQHELRRVGLRFRAKRVETEGQYRHELEQHRPDVILSDHGLPGFDGLQALAVARERCPDTPFIFVTGSYGEEAAVEALKHGAEDYILKSKLQLLGPTVEEALRRASKRVEQQQATAAQQASAKQLQTERLRLAVEEPQAQIERTMRQRIVQLEADYRELEELAYTIADDLRTPLRQIDSLLELLRTMSGDRLDPKSRSCLRTVSESAQHIASLTDELLGFARIGQVEMYRMQFSLADVVREVIQELRRQTEGRSIEWVLKDMPEVTGDPLLLGEALTQLISNALKFTRSRERARIEIGCTPARRELVVFVADNGIGFEPRRRSSLFGVFQKLHPEVEGLGVGLAKVRRIIRRHGGRAWAKGTPGEGATFYFSLPRSP